MRNWNARVDKKKGGPFDTIALRRLISAGKIPENAFIREENDSTDWQQVSTIEWLTDVPQTSETRYCLECDCRVVVERKSASNAVYCPECRTFGRLVNYLEGKPVEIIDAPAEPWGKYDTIACVFASCAIPVILSGAIALFLNPSLAILLGFISLAGSVALFAITFQHRSESSKFRSHLAKVESLLESRSSQLETTFAELLALRRNLSSVRDNLVKTTEEEFNRTRREIADELSIARDQHNAVHRMAERFLDETRKWWTSKLTGQNFQATQERITKAVGFCRKQGYPVTAKQERELLQQLKADYETVLAKERDKAEQSRMREQMREEIRAQRELKKELDRTEKEAQRRETEQDAIQRALDEAMQKVGAEHSAEVQKLRESLQEAQRRVLEAQEMAQRTKSQAELTRVGNVYVISNVGSFGEDGYKVGLTRRLNPLDRIKELGDASVPFPFDIHMMIRSDDAPKLERALHVALHKYRINRVNFRKEFFRVDLETIRRLVEKHHGKIEYEYQGSGEESEYQQSLKISDADFAYLTRVADEQPTEDDDDDMDGLDELVSDEA